MISFHQNITVLALAFLAGCSSLPKVDQKMLTEEVVRECHKRWEWGSQTEVFGIPTVQLTLLDNSLISKKFPGVVVYRVTVVNKLFLFGSGPETSTATCLVMEGRVIFLETDEDVIELLSLLNISSNDAAAAIGMLELFAMLRGLELQIGLPSKDNPWVVKNEDGGPPLSMTPNEQDPNNWTVVLDKAGNIWTIKGTLVSPDDFKCDRYVIRIMGNGHIEIISKDQVLSPIDYI